MKVSNRTKYPKIFGETYWGNFEHNDENFPDEIVFNRNVFVESFDIVKLWQPPCYKNIMRVLEGNNGYYTLEIGAKRQLVGHIDHEETYKTRFGGVVAICSNYGVDPTSAESCPPVELEMSKCLQLYAKTATTWVRSWSSSKEYYHHVAAITNLLRVSRPVRLQLPHP